MQFKAENQLSHSGRRNNSAKCDALLNAATPDLFRNNAFRITGLSVDATTREITKHGDRLKMMEELGQGDAVHTAAFALKSPPSVDQIRDAIQKLRDPEQRIVDELFWFWPEKFGQSEKDPSIRALTAGDSKTALNTWAAKETHPEDGVTAMHNIAVFWHLSALEWEEHARITDLSQQQRQEVTQYWRNAFKRWRLLADDSLFWETITARVMQFDDARLTTGFVRRMRATLPEALGRISGLLALRYAERNEADLALVHIQLMREIIQNLDGVKNVAEMVLSPARTRLKEQIQRAERRADKAPEEAAAVAYELIEHARRILDLFDLFFGKDSDMGNELSDEVAALCNQLSAAYHKATESNRTCLKILKTALRFATTLELRQRLVKNIGTLSDNLNFKKLEPTLAALKAILDSKEHPRILLDRFRSKVVPAIANLSAGMIGDTDARTELFDSAAIVLRKISLTAWNTYQDRTTAIAANEMAIEHARGPDLKRALLEDRKSLAQLAHQKAAQDSSSDNSGLGCLIALGAIGLLAAMGSCDSVNQKSSNSSYTPPSTPSPSSQTPPSSYGASDQKTYQVPNSMGSKLDRDRQAIERSRAQAELRSAQIERLGREIESERRRLDPGNQVQVDAFNRKVIEYNSMIERAGTQDRMINQAVNDYNARLRRNGR